MMHCMAHQGCALVLSGYGQYSDGHFEPRLQRLVGEQLPYKSHLIALLTVLRASRIDAGRNSVVTVSDKMRAIARQ